MNPNIPRMGYFILFKNDGNWISNIIEKRQFAAGFNVDQACWTHVGTSGGGQWLVDIKPPRGVISDITKEHKGKYIRIVRFKNNDYETKGRYKVAFFAASKCNLPYDWKGVLAFIIKWFRQLKDFYFCSELAAWALLKEYPRTFGDLTPDKIMPAHFADESKFSTVWEGLIT
jgi:uncharacterized protein YycO